MASSSLEQSIHSPSCALYGRTHCSRSVQLDDNLAAVRPAINCRLRTLEDMRPFFRRADQPLVGVEAWALPTYGANSSVRINKAAIRLRQNRYRDPNSPWKDLSWHEADALYVPIWKSGSSALDALFSEQLHFDHLPHSFVGRIGTAAANSRSAVAIAIVRDPLQRFESAFRTVTGYTTPALLANASRTEQRRLLVEFVERVWRGEPFFGAEHLLTQMYFLSSTDRYGQPLTFGVVGRTERLDEALRGIENLLKLPQHTLAAPPPKCTLGCNTRKFAGSLLEDAPDALRKVCALYRQDFVCLGYRMPDACVVRPLPPLPLARV